MQLTIAVKFLLMEEIKLLQNLNLFTQVVKLLTFSSGNPARGTNYIVNAPEMYLIKAEANVQLNKLNEAKEALLVVASVI